MKTSFCKHRQNEIFGIASEEDIIFYMMAMKILFFPPKVDVTILKSQCNCGRLSH